MRLWMRTKWKGSVFQRQRVINGLFNPANEWKNLMRVWACLSDENNPKPRSTLTYALSHPQDLSPP
eukprot:scaffold1885_cov161-Ochromonas_danica.AAC.8